MKKTHEQFLEDLWDRNKYYRDGKFRVVGQYECSGCKIGVMDHLNVLLMPRAGHLLAGSQPSIQVAVDKSQYFKSLCHFKFGDDSINDLNEVEYINDITKIKVIDRDYGEYFIHPHKYLQGNRSAKRRDKTASENRRSDKFSIENRIKEIHPELEFTLDEYINRHMYIDVKNKYGVCRVSINSLLIGAKPTIESAINKSEYFANKAIDVHGDKYDYSLVDYKNGVTKVKIVSKYGTFEQAPETHLMGSGCPIEGRKMISNYQRDNPNGWTYTNWEVCAKRSKNFTGYKVYFLECWDKNEIFYKIGRTYKNVGDRFGHKTSMPYQYNILYTIELDDPKRICEIEQEYKNKHSEFKYIPTKKFGGMYECFSQLIFF